MSDPRTYLEKQGYRFIRQTTDIMGQIIQIFENKEINFRAIINSDKTTSFYKIAA